MRPVILFFIANVLLASPVYPQADSLPSIGFASTIASDELYGALKSSTLFASMDKDKPGSPITIRVSHMYGHTSAGTASEFASAILAGGTLGLLPIFSNRDLSVTYDILINGSILLSYTYSKNVTRVFNIHSTDKTYGLGADGLAWVIGTSSQFSADVARDSKFADLKAEYHYYYDAAAPDPAH